jgi:hypothetical protein
MTWNSATETGPLRTPQTIKKKTTALNKMARVASDLYNLKPNIDHIFICRYTSNLN